MESLEETGHTFPANARLQRVQFGEAALSVSLEPGGDAEVPCAHVVSLHGARIRSVTTSVAAGTTRDAGQMLKKMGGLVITATTGIPVGLGRGGKDKKGQVETKEEFRYAIGVRIVEKPDLWYLLNTSFNFRQALGAESGYSAEINLRTFVRKLAEACPSARRDTFFEAMLGGRRLPEPVDTLLEFFRGAYCSAD